MIGPCSGLFGLYGLENGKRCRHVNFYCQKILKSQKNYENLDFSTCGLCLAFKIFLAFFQFSWPSDILNIQNYTNLNYFEAILPLKQFLLKILQPGSVCTVTRKFPVMDKMDKNGGLNTSFTLWDTIAHTTSPFIRTTREISSHFELSIQFASNHTQSMLTVIRLN